MTATDPKQLSSERLALLYQITQTFNSSLDLNEVLETVMDAVIGATRAERGFVVLCEGDELSFQTARGLEQTTVDDPEFQISRSVVEKMVKDGLPVLTSDAQQDDRFSARTSVHMLGLRSIMCAPLTIKDECLGAVYVDNRLKAGIFSLEDLNLLNAIASSAATAIENARLYQVAVEKGRMERELQVAYRVQSSLIPQQVPELDGWDFAARWIPAREVAGDFYDFIPDDQGGMGMVIADVVDKGMPAALFMAFSRTIVRAGMRGAPAPKDAIAEANALICADAVYGMFLTLFYAQFNPQNGEVTYVNAGHNPPLLYRAGEKTLQELTLTGMLLGVDEEAAYEQRAVNLDPGDFIFFYTDGVPDAINDQEQDFGMERVNELLLEHHQAAAEELLETVEETVSAFTGARPSYDDITMLVVKRK